MIIGNFVLLVGVILDEVDEWYFGIYIDVIEWVEIINMCGMSQFVDGGLVGIKLYVSFVNYIDKMSYYCVICFYWKELKIGDWVCLFNSFYWNFFDWYCEKLVGNL